MLKTPQTRPATLFRKRTAALRNLSTINTISQSFHRLEIDTFRRHAFQPEQPALARLGKTYKDYINSGSPSLPAISKWFKTETEQTQPLTKRYALDHAYLSQFGDTIVPYELLSSASSSERDDPLFTTGADDATSFRRFHGPLSLFLTAIQSAQPPRLYIAQAQLIDLPQQLRDDLPTPEVVLKAGKGDVYDSNIWMGIPPTYTPLHKDPNPNLFVQLASDKVVRIFSPRIGAAIFRDVQEKIRSHGSEAFRGDEMMQGPERRALDEAVWNCSDEVEGFEAGVRPGDALFIPKGWWHSIKSVGNDVTASVNWWFR